MKSQSKHFWAMVVLLLMGGAVVNLWAAAGEARVERRALGEFPSGVGKWQQVGRDVRFDAATEAVLRADDYVSRDYAAGDGSAASLYIGYYSTQRTGSTYHSPLNCLPGSGWELSEASTIKVEPVGAQAFTVNRYVIQQGNERQLMLYWYQGRGRAVASEYWDKVYTVLDSIRLRRSDGAMVRVLVPVRSTEEHALETATRFAAEVAPNLAPYVPN